MCTPFRKKASCPHWAAQPGGSASASPFSLGRPRGRDSRKPGPRRAGRKEPADVEGRPDPTLGTPQPGRRRTRSRCRAARESCPAAPPSGQSGRSAPPESGRDAAGIYCFSGTLEHKMSLHPGDRVLTTPGREEKEVRWSLVLCPPKGQTHSSHLDISVFIYLIRAFMEPLLYARLCSRR